MKTLEKRVLKIEAEIKPIPMAIEQVRHRIDELLAKANTSREQVIAEYGSLRAFGHWLMCNSNDFSNPEMNDRRTASEKYMA